MGHQHGASALTNHSWGEQQQTNSGRTRTSCRKLAAPGEASLAVGGSVASLAGVNMQVQPISLKDHRQQRLPACCACGWQDEVALTVLNTQFWLGSWQCSTTPSRHFESVDRVTWPCSLKPITLHQSLQVGLHGCPENCTTKSLPLTRPLLFVVAWASGCTLSLCAFIHLHGWCKRTP